MTGTIDSPFTIKDVGTRGVAFHANTDFFKTLLGPVDIHLEVGGEVSIDELAAGIGLIIIDSP